MNKDRIISNICIRILIAFFIFLLGGILLDGSLGFLRNDQNKVHHFGKVLHKKEQFVNMAVRQIDFKPNQQAGNTNLQIPDKIRAALNKNNCAFQIYKYGTLLAWTDNSLEADIRFLIQAKVDTFSYLKNGNAMYLMKKQRIQDYEILEYIRIKYDFPYENDFLVNDFIPDFGIQGEYFIDTLISDENIPVFDMKGQAVFSVGKKSQGNFAAFPLSASLSYLVAFFFFLMFLSKLLTHLLPNRPNLRFGVQAGLFIFFRFLAGKLSGFTIFSESQLFSPYDFATPGYQSSLGDFLINASFLLLFFGSIDLNLKQNKSKWFKISMVIVGMMVLNAFLLFLDESIQTLVINSTIEFDVTEILNISPQSILAYLSIAFLVLAFIFLSTRVIKLMLSSFKPLNLVFIFLIFALAFFTIDAFYPFHIPWYRYLLLIALPLSLVFILNKEEKISYSQRVLLLFISAVYISSNILASSENKEQEIREVIAINLATEQDYLAETFLDEIEESMAYDMEISNFISINDLEGLGNYLQNNYFSGYWNKYQFQFFVCTSYDSIYNEDNGLTYRCFDFFDNTIDSLGMLVTSSDFYFIDNKDGRISYMGRVPLLFFHDLSSTTLYIELDTKTSSYQLGYPELLITKEKQSLPKDYSYAKYQNGRLVATSGVFLYSLSPGLYTRQPGEFSTVETDGYNHLVYRSGQNSVIVVSMPAIGFFDWLIFLSYLFVFYHLAYTLVLLAYQFPRQISEFRLNIKNRIRFSMIFLVLISMILVGGGTIFYNIKQYNEHHLENLSEKIQSVLVELEHKVGDEHQLDVSMSEYLTSLLIKFSNVFYSDINLYNTDGTLLASSRQEIFDQNLIGRQMNAEAWYQLNDLQKSKYVNHEQLGKMNYLSAYVPFINNDNEVLAYLNLPYFTRHSMLRNEITGLITAVTNIYVLLILLAIFITLFISNNITRPLRLIQKHMSGIDLGGPVQGIDYKGEDEIGQLISQYNSMVVKLNENVQKLAQNERELAWREMARQIAHEIKNPLTPMRLHLQHMQKSIHEKQPGWEDRFNKVLSVLISQIDSLNHIATEFSNFAKMPKSQQSQFNLLNLVNELELLFHSTEKIQFQFIRKFDDELELNSDKELLKRILINLIKNAREAIPEGKKGMVQIEFEKQNNKVFFRIEDNGSGISPDIEPKLFQPNFTTKSRGTGLGLAIVKKSAEEIHATITYSTQQDKGSRFIVELPLI